MRQILSRLKARTSNADDANPSAAAAPRHRPSHPRGRRSAVSLLLRGKAFSWLIMACFLVAGVGIGAWLYSVLVDDDGDAAGRTLSMEEWKAVLERQAKRSAPPHEALGLSQVVFVSCNRHDRSQAYWGYIAAAAQCEMLPAGRRAMSAPCRRLYAGRSPLVKTIKTAAERSLRLQEEYMLSPLTVPVGACGSVVDSTESIEYRAQNKSTHWKAVMRAASGALRWNQVFFPAAGKELPQQQQQQQQRIVAPPPVSGLVWLGDAIYADKRPDGESTQSFGHVEHTMEEVGQMWVAQHDAPMYEAFRESCVQRERSSGGDDAGMLDDDRRDGDGNTIADTAMEWADRIGDALRELLGTNADDGANVNVKDDGGEIAEVNNAGAADDDADENRRGDGNQEGEGEAREEQEEDGGNGIFAGMLDALFNEDDDKDGALPGDAEADGEGMVERRLQGMAPEVDAEGNVLNVGRKGDGTESDRPKVFGTWDDHDMGKNDAGKEYAHRNVTQRYFLDFIEAPALDERWEREGVYAFHTLPFDRDIFLGSTLTKAAEFGGEGGHDARIVEMRRAVVAALREAYQHAVCLVLLDVRSFRDRPNGRHDGDMLGEAQWGWLEQRIREDIAPTRDGRGKCALTLVGGGIQLIADEKTAENWAAFPRSRDRLFGLFRHYKVERVAFLSGDVHMGEIAADFTPRTVNHVMGYPIVEATSSGLTHSAAVFRGAATALRLLFPSPRRVGRLYVERNFGTARLSLDGALAMEALPALVKTFQAIHDDRAAGDVEAVARHRLYLQRSVNHMVNATFTVFSIPKLGRPVLRLNFPLSMLTYEGARGYVAASVVPERGYVYHATIMGPQPKEAEGEPGGDPARASLPAAELVSIPVRSTGGQPGTALVAHYPNNAAPLFTGAIRVLQAYVLPERTISEVIRNLIGVAVLGGIVSFIAFVCWVVLRVQRRRKMRRRAKQYGAASQEADPSDALLDEAAAVAVSLTNYLSGGAEKRKEG
uniref:Alkaline phosphatase n=1 Tax=Herpetomonas muscarum TaxID=5718 RepID=T1YUS2_HERMU|nr:alkaline phosphatase [Herpetomonas muscarum]